MRVSLCSAALGLALASCRGTSPDARVDELKRRLAEAEGRLEAIERTGTKVDAQRVARELAAQGPQGPRGPAGPPGAYAGKVDLDRREARVSVGPGQVASVVAACARARDLVITGGCYADPMWIAELVSARPVGLTDTNAAASWRCDYRNTSTGQAIEVVAEVYCVAPRE